MKNRWVSLLAFTIASLLFSPVLWSQAIKNVQSIFVDSGWAKNSVNTVVFRKNALTSFRNVQYIAFYNDRAQVVLGKRKIGSTRWQLQTTPYNGNAADAHNAISIIVDADGYLHMAWDHHGSKLRYAKSKTPGSLQLTEEMPMTGIAETHVSYPEFYHLKNGKLLFLYRDGQSGQGNLVVNRYDVKTQKWEQLHQNLIDGEKQRNAYWQTCVDDDGAIHISWVWRESSDVASNHDLCYAKSLDDGATWQKSNGEKYATPITVTTAEYVCRISQNSELMNQTSMTANEKGQPIIASYWTNVGDSIPQYHVAMLVDGVWQMLTAGFRKTPFTLSGVGTKRIPISRPQVLSYKQGIAIIFRDEERGGKVSIATNENPFLQPWKIWDATQTSVGSWEPTYDIAYWNKKRQLHLFVQYTVQQDAEGKADVLPQPVYVLKIKKLPQ
jgi:BNR repeat-containing family member